MHSCFTSTLCFLFHSEDVDYAFSKITSGTDEGQFRGMSVDHLRALADQQRLVLQMCKESVEKEKAEGALYLEEAYTWQVDFLLFTNFTVRKCHKTRLYTVTLQKDGKQHKLYRLLNHSIRHIHHR